MPKGNYSIWEEGRKPLLSFSNNSNLEGYLLEMHIITPTQSQEIKFIPRVAVASPSIQIIDESQNKDITGDILNQSGSYSNGFSTLYINFKTGKFPVEGRFYYFKAYNGLTGELYYQDRLFCTAQTEYDKYTVNAGVYTEETTYDNEYIII